MAKISQRCFKMSNLPFDFSTSFLSVGKVLFVTSLITFESYGHASSLNLQPFTIPKWSTQSQAEYPQHVDSTTEECMSGNAEPLKQFMCP